jgi:rubredoxin
LNWHLPVADKEALALKKFIVMNFDQNDISTYGLTFAIVTRAARKIYFTSIVIEKNQVPNLTKQYTVRPTYNVLFGENFDPNSQKYLVYAQDVDQIELPGLLMELSKLYFEQLGEKNEEALLVEENEAPQKKQVHQCSNCLTVYDTDFGDSLNEIAPGTSFDDLPDDYHCSVCASEKQYFKTATI